MKSNGGDSSRQSQAAGKEGNLRCIVYVTHHPVVEHLNVGKVALWLRLMLAMASQVICLNVLETGNLLFIEVRAERCL